MAGRSRAGSTAPGRRSYRPGLPDRPVVAGAADHRDGAESSSSTRRSGCPWRLLYPPSTTTSPRLLTCLSASCVPGSSSHFGQPLPAFPPFPAARHPGLPHPGGLPMTCYYYRKAYYRSYFLSPPGSPCPMPGDTPNRRKPLPIGAAEQPPLLLLRGLGRAVDQLLRHGAGLPRRGRVRGRPGQPHHGRELADARRLHVELPLLPPRRRRTTATLLPPPGALLALDPGDQAEREARAVRGTPWSPSWSWTPTSCRFPPDGSPTRGSSTEERVGGGSEVRADATCPVSTAQSSSARSWTPVAR